MEVHHPEQLKNITLPQKLLLIHPVKYKYNTYNTHKFIATC